MNLERINEIRASIGLKPVSVDPARAAKAKRHERNKRERAEANRAMKAARSKGGK